MSLVGSHVAVGGGLVRVGLREAIDIGAEVIQLFTGNPRGWAPSQVDSKVVTVFRDRTGEAGLPVFVHAPHLINLGSPSEETRERSVAALAHTMERAGALGARGVVVHAGSAVSPELRGTALARLHDTFGRLLDAAPHGVRLLMEPTAGGGEALASTVDSTVAYLAAVDDDRLQVCLDTCHLHAAGEDLSTPAALRRVVTRITRAIGKRRLGLIHVNDSLDPRGSRRDRHETLGKGHIGTAALAALFTSQAASGVPLLVETPTHPEDVATLKSVREQAA